MIPAATVTLELGDIDLSTPVRTLNPHLLDDYDEDDVRVYRTTTVGDLIAEKIIEQADRHGAVTVMTRQRLENIFDEEIRAYARRRIEAAMEALPQNTGAIPVADLTLAARIEAAIRRQLADATTYARGTDATVVESVISTEVTAAFRGLAAEIVEQVRAQVMADIAAHAGE